MPRSVSLPKAGFVIAVLAPLALALCVGRSQEDGFVEVKVKGVLHHGVAVPGDKAKGAVIAAEGVRWPLDLRNARGLSESLPEWHGKTVLATGRLELLKDGPDKGKQVLVVAGLELVRPVKATGPRVKPYIQGYLVAAVVGDVPGKPQERVTEVYLPGVTVSLLDSAKMTVAKVQTDLSGRFLLFPPKPGVYTVCWQADGFVADCLPKPVAVHDLPIYFGKVSVQVERRDKTAVVYGSVRTRDGGVPRTLEPFANVNAFARVHAVDGTQKVLARAYVNNTGDYLLPQVPTDRHLRVEAVIEKLT